MELLAWGANNYGQLGVGKKCEQVDTPIEVQLPSNCNIEEGNFQLAGGGGHTLLADNDDRLYAAGWNNKGQLGLGENYEDVTTFTDVNISLGSKDTETKIRKVACGWDFSVVLLSNGTVYGCGSNAFGQLGLSENTKRCSIFTPLVVESSIFVIDVSCGMRHTLLLDKNGNVYSTGCGKKGQLGLGQEVKRLFTPTIVKDIPKGLSVHCGQHFSAVVTTSQASCDLFMFGDNKYKQVSNTSSNTIYTPHLNMTSSLARGKLIAINCGWTHVVILLSNSNKNKIENWGRNTYGQLGSITDYSDKGHTYVELEDQPIKIASGYEHVLVVTNNGKLYSWGWNEHSNCGVGNSSQNYFQPQLVSIENKTVENCYAGSAHSFALVQSTSKL
jgi:secretion-regulating guanine nucleotide exchange factor